MKNFSLSLVLGGMLLACGNGAFSQTITSAQPGPWNNILTWNGGTIPNASNSTAIVINHNITIPSGFSAIIDQTMVNAGVSLTVNTGGNLNISSAAADELLVDGTLVASPGSTITGTNGTNLHISNTGTYRHSFTTTEGTIPLATWDASSILEISGYTTTFTTATAGGNWGQNFGNVLWNCASQTSTITLSGLLTTIQGNLTVSSTGASGVLRFGTTGASAISVGGDFSVNGGTRLVFCTTGTTVFNVTGNFTQNLSAGYVRLADAGNDGIGTLNLTGDFTLQAGVFTENGNNVAQGNINFVGTAGTIHAFTEAGTPTTTLTNRLAYSVADDNELDVIGESQLAGSGTCFFTLGTNAILSVASTDAAGAIQTGAGQSAAGGNVRVTATNRVFNAGSQVIYNGSGAQFMGNGQPTVAGITTIVNNNAGVTQVAATTLALLGNLTLQTGDLTVSNATLSVGGSTDLQAGDILFTSAATARTLTLTGDVNLGGNITVTSGTTNANVIFGGDITGGSVISFSGINSNLAINGTGDLIFPLAGTTSLKALTYNRSGSTTFNQTLNVNTNAGSSLLSVTAGSVIINGDLNGRDVTLTNASSLLVSGNTALTNSLTITSGSVQTDGTLAITNDLILTAGTMDANGSVTLTDDLTLGSGTTFFFEDQTVTFNSQITNNGGVFSSNSSSTMNILNVGIFGTIAFSPSGNTLGTLTLNRATAGNLVTLNSVLTINSAMNLTDGVFVNTSGLDMASDAVFTRDANASITGAIPTGGPYDLIFTGGNLTTGVEASGSLSDVTSNSSGIVTLGGSLLASGNLFINSGTFTAGANAVSAVNLTNSGTTFNAPSTTLSIAGDFINNGTFNRNNGTVNFTGASTISGSSNPTFQNITISGSLTSPATLNITGNFTNDGVFNPGTGTVVFTNTANGTKTIGGSQLISFNNITIQNNTANPDVSISGNVDLIGVLILNTTAILDADGAGSGILTVVSTSDSPTADGSIATLTGTSAVTGNVTVERFMSIEGASGGRIYRYISAPVQNAPVSDIQAEIPVTGSFTGTSVCTGCGTNQSLFLYNENVITDTNGDLVNDINDGYVDFPSAANSEVFAAGRGYTLFVRGNLLSSALWNLRGSINQGNVTPVSFPSTFTSSGTPANDGWNLVGNPYPSTIDWNAAAGWTKTNVGGTIYVRDNATGQFATWNGSVGVNGGTRYIPIGQAFWIQATAAPTLTANENVKVAGQQTTFLKEAGLTDLLRIAMVKGTLRDETVIHFRNDAAVGYDAETDSRKFVNSTFNLSSVLSTGEILAINSSPFTCSQPVKLNVANAAVGAYTLEFSEMETFNSEIDITLVDNFLNKTIDIATTNHYTFDVTSSPASLGSNRFSVSFSEKAISDELQFSSQQVCEGDNGSVTIQNSRSDINYFLLKDGVSVSDSVQGNGANLILAVSKENLSTGLNNVIIQASTKRCLGTKLYQGSIVVNEKPSVEATSGKACKEGAVTLAASTTSESGSIKWYDDMTSETILFSGKDYTTPVISKSRTYYVSATSTSGCISERKPVLATVVQFEDVIITESEDGVLHSSYSEGNKWFFNGVEMTDEVSSIMVPEKSGTYTVEVSTQGCSTSSDYVFVITAIENQNLAQGISVYPNPVVDKVYIDVERKTDVSKITLHSNMGTVVAEGAWIKEGSNRKGIVDMSSLPTGVYILRLFTSDRILSLKVYKR
ncbi:MAG: T9SS type A sorting domain-containing protein [Chryseolinea sp.]